MGNASVSSANPVPRSTCHCTSQVSHLMPHPVELVSHFVSQKPHPQFILHPSGSCSVSLGWPWQPVPLLKLPRSPSPQTSHWCTKKAHHFRSSRISGAEYQELGAETSYLYFLLCHRHVLAVYSFVLSPGHCLFLLT